MEEQYSPEFKLRVVLDYVRAPRRKQRICNDNNISADLLDKWHQEFIARASQIFGAPPIVPAPSHSNGESTATTYSDFKNPMTAQTAAWGVRINKSRYESVTSRSSAKEPPSWLGRTGRSAWQERGVVIWDEGSRKMEVLTAADALDLLATLRERGFWRTNGIAITKRVYKYKLPETPNPQTSRKGNDRAETPEQGNGQGEVGYEILFHLDPRVGEEFFAFLQEHENLLKQLVEEEKKEATARIMDAYHLLFGDLREREERNIDLAIRPLKWTHQSELHSFVCNRTPDRGTVTLDATSIFWRGCIERPDRFKQWSPPFSKPEEALAWVEQDFLSPQNVTSQASATQSREQIQADEKPSRVQIDLAPFRIDPADLEPKSLSFRIVMDLYHAPESFETMEMSFGKLYRYAEKYPLTTKVARELKIDPSQMSVEQLLGSWHDWYQIYSVAVYSSADAARVQAETVWNQSEVHALYKEGKIRRARYGFEEVETHFRQWLGGLDDPEQPWLRASSRKAHMEGLAMRETFAYALDVDGFREYLGLAPSEISDEELLEMLHEMRAQSSHVPETATIESKKWLIKHRKKKETE